MRKMKAPVRLPTWWSVAASYTSQLFEMLIPGGVARAQFQATHRCPESFGVANGTGVI